MTPLLSKNRALFRVLFLTSLLIISYLAFLPNYDNLPEVASFSDILNHTLAFFVLYILLDFSQITTKVYKKILFFLFYAIFIEVVQYFLPTRCADFYDIVADTSGVFLAYYSMKLAKIYI